MKEILNKENEEYAYKCFEKTLELGFKFKLNNDVKEKQLKKQQINQLLKIPLDGIELNDLLKYFSEEILPYCTNFSNENFMGFPDAGNSVAGISGAIMSDFLQQNLINSSFCAPIATYMEIAVIKWFREILGYKIKKINNIWDVGGVITYGGTGSNSIALLLARENFKKDTMINGVKNPENYKVIIPKGIGHYSIRSALMWIGCGDNIIEVETANYRYDISALRETLLKNKGKIMCVVSYVGDSRTMTIENLKAVYQVVKSVDNNIWLHVDACHGFSLAFSEKLKKKIEGIELFDSISTDPHKVLAIPYCMSALLIKDPEKFKLVTSTSDLIMQEDFAFGQITPFIGSKSWVSLKTWFMMQNLGIKNIGKLIERRCDMAQYLKKQILKSDHFILMNEVNINSVVFVYVDNKNELSKMNINDINALNSQIYDYLLKEGKYYLHRFPIIDNMGAIKEDETIVVLRYMSGNDNISYKDINNMLTHIIEVATKIKGENK